MEARKYLVLFQPLVDRKPNSLTQISNRCHLREKVLAEAATHFIIVADSRKDSKVLGTNWTQGVPIEVAPFAWAKVFQSKFFFCISIFELVISFYVSSKRTGRLLERYRTKLKAIVYFDPLSDLNSRSSQNGL